MEEKKKKEKKKKKEEERERDCLCMHVWAGIATGYGSDCRLKWVPGRGVGHPPTSIAEVKEGIELYLYSPSGLSLPVLG